MQKFSFVFCKLSRISHFSRKLMKQKMRKQSKMARKKMFSKILMNFRKNFAFFVIVNYCAKFSPCLFRENFYFLRNRLKQNFAKKCDNFYLFASKRIAKNCEISRNDFSYRCKPQLKLERENRKLREVEKGERKGEKRRRTG